MEGQRSMPWWRFKWYSIWLNPKVLESGWCVFALSRCTNQSLISSMDESLRHNALTKPVSCDDGSPVVGLMVPGGFRWVFREPCPDGSCTCSVWSTRVGHIIRAGDCLATNGSGCLHGFRSRSKVTVANGYNNSPKHPIISFQTVARCNQVTY